MSILVSADFKFATLADAQAFSNRLPANARMAKIRSTGGTWSKTYIANVDVVLSDAQLRSLFPANNYAAPVANSARNYRFNNATLKRNAVKFSGGSVKATNPDKSVVS